MEVGWGHALAMGREQTYSVVPWSDVCFHRLGFGWMQSSWATLFTHFYTHLCPWQGGY